jgi:hypothetical protein
MRVVALTIAEVILGGIGGALCDQIHVRTGVLTYPESFLLGQPWWVAPVFGLGAPLVLFGAMPFARTAPVPTRRDLWFGFFWFLAAYAGSGLVGDRAPALYAAVLGVTFAARVALARDRRSLLVFSLLLAAGGCLWEGFLSSTGAFAYARPLYWVPIWLPGLYLHGAPLAIAVARALRPAPALTP